MPARRAKTASSKTRNAAAGRGGGSGIRSSTSGTASAAKRNVRRATPAKAPAVAATGRWLVKTEPEKYSISDLERDGTTGWDGVRNHQARNFMRDAMAKGDLVLVYHSNAKPPGVAGVAKVIGPPVPDPTAFDPKSPYFDPGSDPDAPTWIMARLGFVERFPALLPLDAIRDDAFFEGMPLLARGQRLSVQTVDRGHFDRIVKMGRSGRFA
ncbi:MAG: EVE domain-containing protein [Phycisphaerales bacterium]|jgi:predicted RNA-binding protein with PUA-like domain